MPKIEDGTLLPKTTYVGIDGKEYQIYPMKLKDYQRTDRLFEKINDIYLYMNMPNPMRDDEGNFIKDKHGRVKYDYTAYNAMCELLGMALHLNKKEVEKVVDVSNGVEILDEFRNVSGLKKKMQEIKEKGMSQELLTQFSQALSNTQAKLGKA